MLCNNNNDDNNNNIQSNEARVITTLPYARIYPIKKANVVVVILYKL